MMHLLTDQQIGVVAPTPTPDIGQSGTEEHILSVIAPCSLLNGQLLSVYLSQGMES